MDDGESLKYDVYNYNPLKNGKFFREELWPVFTD